MECNISQIGFIDISNQGTWYFGNIIDVWQFESFLNGEFNDKPYIRVIKTHCIKIYIS